MVTTTTSPRSVRKPAVLWTPWGPIPKGGKGRLQVKAHWLPNAICPAGAGKPGETVIHRRGN